LRGVVLDPNKSPLAGAEVSIFDNPEWIRKGSFSESAHKLIASASTGSDGKFDFKQLPSGRYDVRFSARGFNDMHYYVVVKSHSLRNKRFVIVLPLAT
jgi:hypothetical protein